jgi:hypothetical protein
VIESNPPTQKKKCSFEDHAHTCGYIIREFSAQIPLLIKTTAFHTTIHPITLGTYVRDHTNTNALDIIGGYRYFLFYFYLFLI